METSNILTPAIVHAKTEFPKEACGLVVQTGTTAEYFPCHNLSSDPENEFILDPADYVKARHLGTILCIVHSHSDNCIPSQFDEHACNQGDVPWLVIDATLGTYSKIIPTGLKKLPLIGRPFVYGLIDCFTLLKDYYKETLNIDLKDPYRPDDWWEIPGVNLYLDSAKEWGFYKVKELQIHDVLLIQLKANVPNHAAIYVGDGKIMHHVSNRLSKFDPYGGYWLKHTHSIWRHRGTN